MKEYMKQRRSLKEEFKFADRFDSFSGAFFYATLLMLPILFMLLEASIVYMYILTLWVILIIIALILYVFLHQVFYKKSLMLKKPNMKTDTKTIIRFNILSSTVFFAICGLIFLLVLVPILWK